MGLLVVGVLFIVLGAPGTYLGVRQSLRRQGRQPPRTLWRVAAIPAAGGVFIYLLGLTQLDHSSSVPQPSQPGPPTSHILVGLLVVAVAVALALIYRERHRRFRAHEVSSTSSIELAEDSPAADAAEPTPTLPWYRKTFWAWSRIWGGALGGGLGSIPVGIAIHSLAEVLVGVGMVVGGAALAAAIYHYSPPHQQ